MLHYKIMHKTVGEVAGNLVSWDEKIKEWVTDSIANGQGIEFTEQEIDSQELKDIINSRLSKLREAGNVGDGNTFTFGNPDFWPIAFIKQFIGRGLRCSSAVCRLVRDYTLSSDGEKQKLLDEIKSSKYKYSIEELNRLLSIEDASVWGDCEDVSKALEDGEIRKRLKEKLKKVPFGTGFLVGKNYLLTNHHILNWDILKNPNILEEFRAEFLHEQDYLGRSIPEVEYKLDSSFFQTSEQEKLDYTLVKVKPLCEDEREKLKLNFREAGDNFGWLPMFEENKVVAPPFSLDEKRNAEFTVKLLKLIKHKKDDEIEKTVRDAIDKLEKGMYDIPGEPVIIIQHPKGRQKEIVVFNNRVQKLYKDFLQYETDADLGSSGSPVLNERWQLVGLHHATLVDSDEKRVVGNLGIRIKSIVEDLKCKAKAEIKDKKELEEFLRDYVVLKDEKPIRGRIFILANYVKDDLPSQTGTAKQIWWDEKLNKWVEKIFGDGTVEVEFNSNSFNGDAAEQQMIMLRDRIITKLKKEFQEKYRVEVIPVIPDKGGDWKDADEAIKWINDKHEYKVGDVALQIYTGSCSPQPSRRGASVFYIGKLDERKVHAELLLQSLLNKVPDLPSQGAESDEATKDNGLDFCRDVIMPSLRMRVGYASNDDDLTLINTKQECMAEGIAKGLISWVNSLSPIIMFDG